MVKMDEAAKKTKKIPNLEKEKKPTHEESLTLKDWLGMYCQVVIPVWVNN
jgi:hypothetical protein